MRRLSVRPFLGRPVPLPRIVVTAAVIEEDGKFLVTRRPDGVHLEGFWEFPGGKCEQGESHAASLEREIAEELDAAIVVGGEVFSTVHTYTDRVVELHFFAGRLTSAPRAVLGQEMRWVTREELRRLPFPPADEELIRLLDDGSIFS
jgi:8-oxo-dGTP diphosphatase